MFLMVDLPPVLEFVIIATSAGLISYAIHLAVSRSTIAMLMFNGVRAKKPPVSQQSRADAAQPRSVSSQGPHPLRG